MREAFLVPWADRPRRHPRPPRRHPCPPRRPRPPLKPLNTAYGEEKVEFDHPSHPTYARIPYKCSLCNFTVISL